MRRWPPTSRYETLRGARSPGPGRRRFRRERQDRLRSPAAAGNRDDDDFFGNSSDPRRFASRRPRRAANCRQGTVVVAVHRGAGGLGDRCSMATVFDGGRARCAQFLVGKLDEVAVFANLMAHERPVHRAEHGREGDDERHHRQEIRRATRNESRSASFGGGGGRARWLLFERVARTNE